MLPAKLKKHLEDRGKNYSYRSLHSIDPAFHDFSSNDYLGFARSADLGKRIQAAWEVRKDKRNGSAGSRLLGGNHHLTEQLEVQIASFHQSESALLFNSGYDANLALFSCLPQRGDTILYDELIHASIHDGRRLSLASSYKFKHNDISHLTELLRRSKGEIYVAVESVYSMDGDLAPLAEMAAICKEYNAKLIVDEAHATGIFGNRGEGRVVELNIQDKVFARVHTFGKAMGIHGAAVLGDSLLREYLINFARSFIYTTALPLHTILSIREAYELVAVAGQSREALFENISFYRKKFSGLSSTLTFNRSPIQVLVIPGNPNVRTVAEVLKNKGFSIKPVLSPTVPEGKERLRICLHAFNTKEEIIALAEVLQSQTAYYA